jgi:hypothetical protein
MPDLEAALQELETAQRELVAENPEDFGSLSLVAQRRSQALDSVLALLETAEPSAVQLGRLKRVHLGGILSVERIRLAREGIREEVADLSRQERVISGYRAGSSTLL